MGTVMLVDGSGILVEVMRNKLYKGYRIYDGTLVGGLLGFLNKLHIAMEVIRPTRCIVVWDRDVNSVRKSLLPDYRKWWYPFSKSDKETSWKGRYDHQKGLVITLLQYLGVENYEREGFEARDLICRLGRSPVDGFFDKNGESSSVVITSQFPTYRDLLWEDPDGGLHVSVMNPFTGSVMKGSRMPPKTLLQLSIKGDETFRVPKLSRRGSTLSSAVMDASFHGRTLGDFTAYLMATEIEFLDLLPELHRNYEVLRFSNKVYLDNETEDDLSEMASQKQPQLNPEAASMIFGKYELYKFEKDLGGFLTPFEGLGGDG